MIHDTWLMFMRNVQRALRNPIWMVLTLIQPMLYMALFMPLLSNLGSVPGLPQGRTVTVFVPGLLVLIALFGSAFEGFGLVAEIRHGVIERFLVTPVRRPAILLGAVLKDVAVLLIQCAVIVAVAAPFGLELHLLGILISLALFAAVAFAMASMSYAFAIIYKNEDSLASTLNALTLPVSLLSGIMLPMALAPLWLQGLAHANPLLYAVDGARALFAGNLTSSDVLIGLVVSWAMALVIFRWALSALNKMAA